MKKSSPVTASHVNEGTALAEEDRPCEVTIRRAFRGPKLTVSAESSDTTEIGGLALAACFLAKLKIAQRIDKALSLLCVHRGLVGVNYSCAAPTAAAP